MDDIENIFNPTDGSLEARASAFRRVYRAWQNAEASLKHQDDEEWRDSLGDREEIGQALKVSQQSIHMAADAFSREEIAEAKNAHLLDDDEALELIQHKLQDEMQQRRASHQRSDSSEHRQK